MQFTGKVNFYIVAIVANSNILMIAGILFTAEINGCFRCYLICCAAFSGKLPAFISICSCIPQLAYVYSISIFSTCCYIDNLTVSVFSAYGYCISSVSYAAGTQSNSAFTGNFGIMTENNSVINSCFGYFISRAENNVIPNINGSACINIGRSHCRSHACTGHNTCCNQHCQQLFRRAAFTAMIFRDFGDNNVCVARLTPNYFEYFVHIDSSSFLCILAQEIILVCTKHFAAD